MKKIKDITEEEMVAVFLKAEINSDRFGSHIHTRLNRDQKDRALIDKPDLENEADNQYRKQLLGEYRGYGLDQYLFEKFPLNVKWARVFIDRTELKKIRYLKDDYWIKLSQGTRMAKDSVDTIKKGLEISNISNQGYLDAAKSIKQGTVFPEMILVSTDLDQDIVVIEGHLRLTAYLLANDDTPDQLEVLIGHSSELVDWNLY